MAASGFDDAKSFWDSRFAAPEYIFGTEPNAFLRSQQVLFRSGMRVLDIACGEGRNAVWLAKLGCEVVGIDLSPKALAKAANLQRSADVAVTWVEADIRDWKWKPDQFDAVLSIFIQFAAPEGRAKIFDGMQRTLRAGGHLMIEGFTPRQLQYQSGGPRNLEHLYTEALLRESFGALDIVHLREHDVVLKEGTKHSGTAALIDLVARKPSRRGT